MNRIPQSTLTQEVPKITWEVEAALRDMKNGTATGNDHINIETLKAGEDTISKTLAKLYTECLSERIPTAWKNAKMMILFKKGNKKDHKNYRPIRLLSNIYKVLMKVLTKRPEDTRRKPATRARWIQKHTLSDRPHPRRKPTEGEVQRI